MHVVGGSGQWNAPPSLPFAFSRLCARVGPSGDQNQTFGVRRVAKTNFSQQFELLCFWGPFLMTFGVLGNTLFDFFVFFGAQTCRLANLLSPLWHPGGPWDDPGTPGSTRTETLGS